MVCIKERKLGEDGQLVGYLLERDGLLLVVSLRDLYDESIVSELISAGYKYHDYYGDIENEAGIPIDELSSSKLTPEDNTSFMSCFEDSALTEQQMMQYFSLNMKKVEVVEFRAPVEVRIHTREELIAYLKGFNNIRQRTAIKGYILPINAICAPEALFSVEELEQDSDNLRYMELITMRRTFVTRNMISQAIDVFIEMGLMTEDDRNNPDMFIKSWCAWGPEGINTKCIEARWMQDVIFQCDVIYSGTGKEELTFDSKASTIRHKVTSTTLEGVNYTTGYGLMDKQGNVYYDGNKLTPNDVISNSGNILLTDDVQQKYNKYRRDAANWAKPYRIIEVVKINHLNRMCFTLQIETGQLYQFRMDRELWALVGTHSHIYSSVFGKIKIENGNLVNFSVGFNRDVIVEQLVFRTLVKEIIESIIIDPPFASTVDMCVDNGMNYEQIIDYIEYLRGHKEASPVLHDALPGYFYSMFGEGLENLGEEATLLDKLELFMQNLENKTDPNSPDYIDLAAIISDSSKINKDEWNAAIYVAEEKPAAKINAVLSFGKDECAGEQYVGRMNDSRDGLLELFITLIKSAYKMSHDEYESNSIMQEIVKIKNGEYFDIRDKISSVRGEYNGCLVDHGKLNMTQMSTAQYSIWVMGVISEIAGRPLEERRHLAFYGWKMNIGKGSTIRRIVDRIITDLDMQTKKDQTFFAAKDRIECTRSYCTYILKLIWAIRSGNALFRQDSEGNVYYEVSRVDSVGRSHTASIMITAQEYHYIVNPACVDFTPFTTTLFEWCKYSMFMDCGSLNFYAVCENARITPWYVQIKDGYPGVPLYNGALNLIPSETWDTYYRQNNQPMYNSVMQQHGRAPICVVDRNVAPLFQSHRNAVIDLAVFEEENKRLGVAGKGLPATMIDYYMDDNRDEPLNMYYTRALHYVSKPPAGQRLAYMPLKADIYYQNIAYFYEENPVLNAVYMENMMRPTEAVAPIMITSASGKKALDVNQVKIYKYADYRFNSQDLAQCSSLILGNYVNKADCYVGKTLILTADKRRLSIGSMTETDVQNLVDTGCAYQVNAHLYIIYASNGAFVCEV